MKVLFVCGVTLPKLTPVLVLVPPELTVPMRFTPKAETAFVPEEPELVVLMALAVPVVLI